MFAASVQALHQKQLCEDRMKEFNLEHALAGAPVANSNGQQVTEIHQLKTVTDGYCIVAVIGGVVRSFVESGKYAGMSASYYDLFMAPAFTLNDKEYYFDDVVMLKGQRTVVNAETLPEIKTALMYPDLVKPVARKKMWAQMFISKKGIVGNETWRENQQRPEFAGRCYGTQWIGDPVSYEVEE